MGGLLQPNLGEMRGRVTAAFWHLRNLLQNEVVEVGRGSERSGLQDGAAEENPDQLQHAGPIMTNTGEATGDIGFRQRIC